MFIIIKMMIIIIITSHMIIILSMEQMKLEKQLFKTLIKLYLVSQWL